MPRITEQQQERRGRRGEAGRLPPGVGTTNIKTGSAQDAEQLCKHFK